MRSVNWPWSPRREGLAHSPRPRDWRRTAASTSTKVGSALAYHAACRVGSVSEATRAASRMVRLKSPSRHGVVRPTARGLHCRCVSKPQMGADFREGAFDRPPTDVPGHDLGHGGVLVGAEEGEGLPFPRRVAQEHPAQWQWRRPIAVPERGAGRCPVRQVHGEPLAGVPIDCRRVPGGPRRVGVGEPLLQPRLPRPLLGLDARLTLGWGLRWDRVVELGAEQQPRDEPHAQPRRRQGSPRPAVAKALSPTSSSSRSGCQRRMSTMRVSAYSGAVRWRVRSFRLRAGERVGTVSTGRAQCRALHGLGTSNMRQRHWMPSLVATWPVCERTASW